VLELGDAALVFPAVSFLMLAYGQRYVALSGRIRQLVAEHTADDQVDALRLRQIEVLRRRVGLIRVMQSFAVLALLASISSTAVLLVNDSEGWWQRGAKVLFGGSLVAMVLSLLVTLWEIQLSSVAVDLQIASAEIELRKAPRFDTPT
jgi:hypothetical protein